MIGTTELPSIDELHDLIESVDFFPITAGELTQLAVADGAGRRVIDFYRWFPSDQVFVDRDDLSARSEQVHLMSEEETKQPWEIIRSPQE